jgi:hypothetical protein
MTPMTEADMQQIDGGGKWAAFACGAALAVAIGGAVMISAGTGGLAGPLVFAAGYSFAPASCALNLL